jgi:hypothetical protein
MIPVMPNAQLLWQRSKACTQGSCVEVARELVEVIMIRDSKNPEAGALCFSRAEWDAFVDAIKSDEFDLSES